jgi:preprotein translocase subunit YajC
MLDRMLAASANAAHWLLAESGAASAPGPGGGLLSNPLILIVLVFGIFYFVMFRDQRKKKGQRQQMLESLKKGDKVLTIGGAMGTIVGVKDNEITVKVDESSNTRIVFVRSAIDRVVSSREDAQSPA